MRSVTVVLLLLLLLLVLHPPFLILVLLLLLPLLLILMISRSILMRKVRAWRLDNLELSGADCFVLDMLADNLPHTVMDQVRNTNKVMDKDTRNLTFFHLQLLGEISKRISPKPDPDMIDNHNQSLLKSTTAL